jgi:hypothetical protein
MSVLDPSPWELCISPVFYLREDEGYCVFSEQLVYFVDANAEKKRFQTTAQIKVHPILF